MQRDLHPGRELRHQAAAVERDDPRAVRAVAVHRQKPTAAVVPVRDREVDLEHAHLEHVSRIGTFDIDGPRENVSAGALVGHLGEDIAPRWRWFNVWEKPMSAIRTARSWPRGIGGGSRSSRRM